MNPSHYERGWHATSTIGTIGAAATASRLLGQKAESAARTMAIAASEACGIKESFGTMVKPLQAGLAGRNGVLAVQLAEAGFTATDLAIEGSQGLLVAMQASCHDSKDEMTRLGRSWEIVDGGITVKLYPSCAATHPAIDTLLDLRKKYGFTAADIDQVKIGVDSVTPTVLIHDRPETGLQGKFSMHFCAASAVAHGRIDLQTFEPGGLSDLVTRQLLPRVTMYVDPLLGADQPPLTEAKVAVHLRDGSFYEWRVRGARGYPSHPPSTQELDQKFQTCAERAVSASVATEALAWLRELEYQPLVGSLADLLNQSVSTSIPS